MIKIHNFKVYDWKIRLLIYFDFSNKLNRPLSVICLRFDFVLRFHIRWTIRWGKYKVGWTFNLNIIEWYIDQTSGLLWFMLCKFSYHAIKPQRETQVWGISSSDLFKPWKVKLTYWAAPETRPWH